MTVRRRPNKYGAQPLTIDGIRFASKVEAGRYQHLKLLERAGEIINLELQPRFKLEYGYVAICTYVGDFRYRRTDADGREVVEDVKGYSKGASWQMFRVKANLLYALHSIPVMVVRGRAYRGGYVWRTEPAA